MRVGFDVDGVLANFTWAFSREAHILDPLIPIIGNSAQETWRFPWSNRFYDKVWDEVDNTYNWWMGLEPLVTQEEINAINFLINNHDVFFITNRKRTKGYSAETQTRLWLQSIGILADHATVIATNSSKGLLCSALDLETFIDDKPKNVEDILRDSTTSPCIIDRKYNKEVDTIYRFKTVKDYVEWTIEISRILDKS